MINSQMQCAPECAGVWRTLCYVLVRWVTTKARSIDSDHSLQCRRGRPFTGPGGAGKTRLAMAVAFEVVEDFEDGVWWMGLRSPISCYTSYADVARSMSVSM